jgi:hypothetical protein
MVPSGGLSLDALPVLFHTLDAQASRGVKHKAFDSGPNAGPALPIRKLLCVTSVVSREMARFMSTNAAAEHSCVAPRPR